MTFDVEEYRADLTRRQEALKQLGYAARERWSDSFQSDTEFYNEWARCRAKAQGIQIALDLLPRAE
jgi:hypothetical protein